MSGFFYILQEREFINSGEPIFKIGRTNQKDVNRRFKAYPKSSEVIWTVKCPNSKLFEYVAVKLFQHHFTARPDIGREYFHGDIHKMIELVRAIASALTALFNFPDFQPYKPISEVDDNNIEEPTIPVEGGGEVQKTMDDWESLIEKIKTCVDENVGTKASRPDVLPPLQLQPGEKLPPIGKEVVVAEGEIDGCKFRSTMTPWSTAEQRYALMVQREQREKMKT